VVAVCAPAVAVTVTEYVPAGVPDVGGVPPVPLPPHAARSARPPTSAATGRMRRARRTTNSSKIPMESTDVRRSDADSRRAFAGGTDGPPRRIGGGGIAAIDAVTTAEDGRAVVVTVSVLPEMVQPPAGMEQVAASVGLVLKPVSLIWNVKALPAEPVCEGCDGVTAGEAVNVAVTLVLALIANVQTELVLAAHAPDQLVKDAFAAGTAVSVIDVPELKLAPVGDCVIVPGPLTVVVRVYCAAANVAVTDVFAEMLKAQVVLALPLHAPPDQLVNVAPLFGTAVSVIVVPDGNEAPVGDCMIVPGPLTVVVSVYCAAANVAVTDVFAEMLKAQIVLVLPLQAPPDQLVNVAPLFGTAVSVIAVPDANEVPVGDCVIVPGPTTFVANENWPPENVAVTVVFALSVTIHTVGTVLGTQALDDVQLTNVAPALAKAVRTTSEPGANEVPVGDCVIVPGPTTLVVSVTLVAKFAVTIAFEFSTTVHVVAPERVQVAPVQLTNEEFALGVSVSVMVVLFGNDAPVGDCATVPGPMTLAENVNFVTVVTAVPVNAEPVSAPLGPLILSVAARPPKACGAKVIVIEHDDPTAIGVDVQLLV
jgi:hypothetical protein